MITTQLHIEELEARMKELEIQLLEAQSIIEAIQEGSIDALVLNTEAGHSIYTLESADYTYRVLIEKVQEGALSISETGLILYSNEYFSKLINIPSDKLTGTYFNDYIDSVEHFQSLRDALATGYGKGEITLNIGGRKLDVYISLTDLNPFVPAIGIIVTDLTQKRKHEETLINHRKELEIKIAELNSINTDLVEFIHVISHDIKEPLRKIVAYSTHLQQVSKEKFNNTELRLLNVVCSSATRLNSLVDDLVKYTLNDNKAAPETVCLNEVLNDVIEDLEMDIHDKHAIINTENLPAINGSKVQMRQLFLNLLTNALKFQKPGTNPSVKITSTILDHVDTYHPLRKYHCVSIRDNGIGIEKEMTGKIFMIFQRLHTRDEYTGNGVGLAICKKIMENHSGFIRVESIYGEGTTFNIFFPITDN